MRQRFVNNFDWQFIAAVKGTPSSGSPATELGYGILQISQAAAAALPVLGAGQWFIMTAFKRDGSIESAVEVVKVLGVDEPGYATAGECRLRVERGREGTTPQTYISGDALSMRWTASGASNMLQATANLSDVQDPAAALANLGATPTGAALLMAPSIASAKSSMGLGNVDNTRDADKPISTAVANALGGKAPTTHQHTVAQLSDSTALGRSLMTAADQSAARAAIGAGTSGFSGAYGDLTDKPSLGSASSLNVAASGNAAAGEVVKGNDTRLADARDPKAHQHTAVQISDSSALGRTVVTAPDRWTARDAIGVLSGFENRFLNGNMNVCQRAPRNAWVTTGNPSGATTPSADRWLVTFLGAAWATGQASVGWVGAIGMANALIIQTVGTYAGAITAVAAQRIAADNVGDLAGQTVTVSGYIYHNANGPVLVDFFGATPNTADNWSGATTAEFSTPTTSVPPGVVTPVSQTVVLSNAVVRGLSAAIRATGSGNATGSTSIYFTGLQVRLGGAINGASALALERRPYEQDLMMCTRYLRVLDGPSDSGSTALFAGQCHTATQHNFSHTFPLPMRVPPVISTSGADGFAVESGGALIACSGLAFSGITTGGCRPYATTATAMTVGRGALLVTRNLGNASRIVFDAEL